MKELTIHQINGDNARTEWQEFESLLASSAELKEQDHILPFFKQRHDLSLLIGTYFPHIFEPNCYAHEYDLGGCFRPDLIVGDSTNCHYLLVEFEDATPNSIFKKATNTGKIDWSHRLERAHSQLTDWLWKLDDLKSTSDFRTAFRESEFKKASFHCIVIIGKDMNLGRSEKDRLNWRIQKTMINSISIKIISFNELLSDCDVWLKRYYRV